MFVNKYSKTYFNLISNAKNRTLDKNVYVEKHHIIPKSLGGTNQKENIVRLLLKEHYVAHHLLIHCYEGKEKAKMVCAWYRMIHGHQNKFIHLTSRQYQTAKEQFSKSMSILQTGKIKSEETRRKLSIANKGKILSKKTRDKISKTRMGVPFHCQNPGERNKKISQALMGHIKSSEWVDKINRNPEKIRKMAEKHRGMKRSILAKQNMSMAKKGKSPHNIGKKYFYNPDNNEKVLCYSENAPAGFINGVQKARGKSHGIKGGKYYYSPTENKEICLASEQLPPNGYCSGRRPKLQPQFYNNTEYEVLTDDGFKDFLGISAINSKETLTIITATEKISCTNNHLIFNAKTNEYVLADQMSVGDFVKTQSGESEILKIRIGHCTKKVCDLVNVKDTHSFFANQIKVSNCLILDEFAFVPNNIATDFFKSVYPTITAGTNTKIIIVSTANGVNLFYKLWHDAEAKLNSYSPFKAHWSEIPGRDDAWKQETIRNIGAEAFRIEFENEFFGSVSDTLISSSKLANLVFDKPIHSERGLDVFDLPEAGKEYVICVDTARGDKNNCSAFTVIQISNLPYKVVAKYRSNEISAMAYPEIIVDVAKKYNESYILVEINDIGGQVVDIIKYELEYENVLSTTIDKKLGAQKVAVGQPKGFKLGLRTTKSVKRIGCSNLKTMIEEDRLVIKDFDIISELSSFVSRAGSFAADAGYDDDLVMSLVMFGWLTSQKYFKNITPETLKTSLTNDGIFSDIPFAFRNAHVGESKPVTFVEDGDLWMMVDDDYMKHRR